MQFKDHFSKQAECYTRFRPRYPDALFEFLASLSEGRGRAWDCGAGNGQAAVGLAPFFDEVLASDASAAQIAQAETHPKVSYFVAPAERTDIAAHSVDLVIVAQALHWFDFEAFYREVRRVTKPGGALVVWCYGLMRVNPAVDPVIERLYADILGSYWPGERAFVDEHYRTIPFPFTELLAPNFEMEAQWGLDDLVGYLGTWSAVQRYREQNGTGALEQVLPELKATWGDAADIKRVSWPLYLRAGRV